MEYVFNYRFNVLNKNDNKLEELHFKAKNMLEAISRLDLNKFEVLNCTCESGSIKCSVPISDQSPKSEYKEGHTYVIKGLYHKDSLHEVAIMNLLQNSAKIKVDNSSTEWILRSDLEKCEIIDAL